MHGAQDACLNACSLRRKCTCTRACTPMQRCRKFFAVETIAKLSWVLREHRAGCRLPPALLQSRRNQSPDAVRSRNPSKPTLSHDVVAAVVSHKHHLIIHVAAGLIQFVHGSHSKRGHGAQFIWILLSPSFRASFSTSTLNCVSFASLLFRRWVVESRALMCHFKQSDLSAWSLWSWHPTHTHIWVRRSVLSELFAFHHHGHAEWLGLCQ